MKLNIKNNKKGFTLVEILLVVGFIAIASIGIYVVYNKVNSGGKANAEARNLDVLRAGIKNLYGANNNYNGINAQIVDQAGITPDVMNTNPTITNSFGGAVTIGAVNLGTGTNNGFAITYNNVPPDVCAKLVPTAGAQFDQVTIGAAGAGTVAKAFGSNFINPANVAAGCNAGAQGAAGNGLTIVFESI